MEKYKNKWFRLTLEKDLKNEDLGVNVHCREDGIHITVPPYPTTADKFTDTYATEMLREDYDTERIVGKIKEFTKAYDINVELDEALYGDNIKLKLTVENV